MHRSQYRNNTLKVDLTALPTDNFPCWKFEMTSFRAKNDLPFTRRNRTCQCKLVKKKCWSILCEPWNRDIIILTTRFYSKFPYNSRAPRLVYTSIFAEISSAILSFWRMWSIEWMLLKKHPWYVVSVWFLIWTFLTDSLIYIHQKETTAVEMCVIARCNTPMVHFLDNCRNTLVYRSFSCCSLSLFWKTPGITTPVVRAGDWGYSWLYNF